MADKSNSLHPFVKDVIDVIPNLPSAHKAVLEEIALTNELYLEQLLRHAGISDNLYHAVAAKALKAPVKQSLLIALAEIAYTPERRAPLWLTAGPTALKSLVTKWSLTKQESSDILYNPKVTEAVLVSALRAGQFSKEMLREVTEQIGGELKLAGLVASLDTLSDEELSFQMRYASTWIGKRKTSKTSYFSAILHSRPFLAASYLESGSEGQIASLAASPFMAGHDDWAARLLGLADESGKSLPLTRYGIKDNKYTLYALVNSPAVSDEMVARFQLELESVVKNNSDDKDLYEVYNQLMRNFESRKNNHRPAQTTSDLTAIQDKDLYQALVYRAKPSVYKTVGRPFDLYALLQNPLLVKLPKRMIGDLLAALTNELVLDEISLLQGSDISALLNNTAQHLADAGLITIAQKAELTSFSYSAKRAELHESEYFEQSNLTTTQEQQASIDSRRQMAEEAERKRAADSGKAPSHYWAKSYYLVTALPATKEAMEMLLSLLPDWRDSERDLIDMVSSLIS